MSQVKSPDQFIDELWSYADEVPMEQHPWFHGIIHHRWTPEQRKALTTPVFPPSCSAW